MLPSEKSLAKCHLPLWAHPQKPLVLISGLVDLVIRDGYVGDPMTPKNGQPPGFMAHCSLMHSFSHLVGPVPEVKKIVVSGAAMWEV